MSIYNEYLVGQEREEAIQEAKMDNEFARLMTLLEMTQLQAAQMERDAELKVFEESGTYDDLTYLLEEAQENTQQKSQGILQKIVSAISSIFASIGNAIKSIFQKNEDPNVDIEVPESSVNDSNLITKAVNSIKSGINKLSSGDIIGGATDIGKVAIPTVAAVAAGAAGVKMIKMKVSQRNQMLNEQESNNKTVTGWITTINSKLGDFAKKNENNIIGKALGKLKELGNAITKFVKGIGGAVAQTVDNVKTSAKNAVAGVEAKEYKFQKGAFTYFIHPNGSYECKDTARNTAVTRTIEQLPGNVQKIVNALTGNQQPTQGANNTQPAGNEQQANESVMTLEEAQEILGADYTVEMTEDGSFAITEKDIVTIESEVAKNIFGMDPEDMAVVQEADNNDTDVDALADLLAEL